MAKQKTRKIVINQHNGFISCLVDGEPEYSFDANFIIERVNEGYMTGVSLGNIIAELIHDCLNCKTAKAELHDLNDTKSYSDCTYFSSFDYITNNQ